MALQLRDQVRGSYFLTAGPFPDLHPWFGYNLPSWSLRHFTLSFNLGLEHIFNNLTGTNISAFDD
jgi:hypothetical protein